MNVYRSRDGEERLWYETDEIERLSDAQLRAAKLMPTVEETVTNLETLVERHLGAELDQYADLPDGVLGATTFRPDGSVLVQIASDITEAADGASHDATGPLGRWRATMAHEASHVILHRRLFAQHGGSAVMLGRADAGLGPCLHRDIAPVRGTDTEQRSTGWKEVQANMGMAALLMPRSVFKRAARTVIADAALDRHRARGVAIVEELARQFRVSKQAAQIRMLTLGIQAL